MNKKLPLIIFILGLVITWCVWTTNSIFSSKALSVQFKNYKTYNHKCIDDLNDGQKIINKKLDNIYNILIKSK